MTRLSVVNKADNTPHTAANDIAAAYDHIFKLDINSSRNPSRFLPPLEFFMTMSKSEHAYVLDGHRIDSKVMVYTNDNYDIPVLEHKSYDGILSTDKLIAALSPTIGNLSTVRLSLDVLCYELYMLKLYVLAEYFASEYGDANAADFYSMLAIKTINELNNGLPEELSCLNFDYDLLTQKI